MRGGNACFLCILAMENKVNLTILILASHHLIKWNANRHFFGHKRNPRTFLLVGFDFSFCQPPPSTLLSHYLFDEMHSHSNGHPSEHQLKPFAAGDV